MKYWLHITSVPEGEAPLWVRECWVGLMLPLAQTSKSAQLYNTGGVLTGPRNLFTVLLHLCFLKKEAQMGYLVNALAAVEILETQHPSAANWWRENTPHLVRPNVNLFFFEEAGFVTE